MKGTTCATNAQTVNTPVGAICREFDARGRVTREMNPLGRDARWTYDDAGRVKTQTLSDGEIVKAVSQCYYDRHGRLARITHRDGLGHTLADFHDITYDAQGRRTAWRAHVPVDMLLNGHTAYAYDAQGRLTSEISTRYAGYRVEASYDDEGNPTLLHHRRVSYSKQGQARGERFAYDAQGNPTLYDGLSCRFDAAGRLLRLGNKFSAKYDQESHRMEKEVGGERTKYHYQGDTLMFESAGDGAVTALHTVGPCGVAIREARADGRSHWQTTYYLCDAQGDVALRLDGRGVAVGGDLYDAWGQRRAGGRAGDPYGYKARWGYYTDWETGLLLCTRRYYDPELGRFLTRDPLAPLTGRNPYLYCNNDPVNRVDPSGMLSFEANNALKDNRNIVNKVAQKYGIQPELLGGVVWVENYGGRLGSIVPGVHAANEWESRRKFVEQGVPASIGLTQVTWNPNWYCKTREEREAWYNNYTANIEEQIDAAARRLLQILQRPERRGPTGRYDDLSEKEMSIVLTEYNQGTKGTPLDKAKPSPNYGQRFLNAYGDISTIVSTGKTPKEIAFEEQLRKIKNFNLEREVRKMYGIPE